MRRPGDGRGGAFDCRKRPGRPVAEGGGARPAGLRYCTISRTRSAPPPAHTCRVGSECERAAAPPARWTTVATGAGVCFPDAGAACTPLSRLEQAFPQGPAIRAEGLRPGLARWAAVRRAVPAIAGAATFSARSVPLWAVARAVYHSGSAFARRFDYIAGRFGPLRRKTAHLYRCAGFLHFTFLQFAHIINHEGHESLRTCRGARRRG